MRYLTLRLLGLIAVVVAIHQVAYSKNTNCRSISLFQGEAFFEKASSLDLNQDGQICSEDLLPVFGNTATKTYLSDLLLAIENESTSDLETTLATMKETRDALFLKFFEDEKQKLATLDLMAPCELNATLIDIAHSREALIFSRDLTHFYGKEFPIDDREEFEYDAAVFYSLNRYNNQASPQQLTDVLFDLSFLSPHPNYPYQSIAQLNYFSTRLKISQFYVVHLGQEDFEHATHPIRVLPFQKFCRELGLP
jgi:hypothetical protein